jgi:hypothetical protein
MALVKVEEGLKQLEITNRIDTGTRAMQRQALIAIHRYLVSNAQ